MEKQKSVLEFLLYSVVYAVIEISDAIRLIVQYVYIDMNGVWISVTNHFLFCGM